LATLVPLLAPMWLGINFERTTEGGQLVKFYQQRMQGDTADEMESKPHLELPPQVVEMPVPWESLIPFGKSILNELLWLSPQHSRPTGSKHY